MLNPCSKFLGSKEVALARAPKPSNPTFNIGALIQNNRVLGYINTIVVVRSPQDSIGN